jgi:hypothetical protein
VDTEVVVFEIKVADVAADLKRVGLRASWTLLSESKSDNGDTENPDQNSVAGTCSDQVFVDHADINSGRCCCRPQEGRIKGLLNSLVYKIFPKVLLIWHIKHSHKWIRRHFSSCLSIKVDIRCVNIMDTMLRLVLQLQVLLRGHDNLLLQAFLRGPTTKTIKVFLRGQ